MENRIVTIQVSLSEMMKDFGYVMEFDAFSDVYHDGYSIKDLQNMNFNFSKELEGVEKIFPYVVASVLEDLERDSYVRAMAKAQIDALKESLLKIDLTSGGAEYLDSNQKSISAKAGVTSVEIDESKDLVTIEILNPEHLINAIVNGVGMFYPDLSSEEPASVEEIKSKIHHLVDYFEVWGESKPEGVLSNYFSPDVNDKELEECVKEMVSGLDLDEIVGSARELIDNGEEVSQVIQSISKLVQPDKESIKDAILASIDKDQSNYEDLKKAVKKS